MIIDPQITDLLEEFGSAPWSGKVWRHVFENREPLDPSWQPGRWSPGGLFPILYTSTARDGALAEDDHLIAQYSIAPSRKRRMASIEVELTKVLDLTIDNRLVRLGVDLTTFAIDAGRCPEIGAAANLVEVQGFLAPSARYAGNNLMIFTERLDKETVLEVRSTEEIES